LPEKKSIGWVYVLSAFFIALNAYFIVKEQYLFSLFPLALIIILVAIFALDKLWLGIVFFIPVSMPLYEFVPGLDFNMFLPTEPLLFGVLLLFIFKLIHDGKFNREILIHPLTGIIIIHLFWILITSLTSSMPIVSIKFLISRLWFVVGFYVLGIQFFSKESFIKKYFWFYTFSLLIVIVYTLIRQSHYGFMDQEAANFTPNPLYNDHTAYGAALAMIIPVIIGLLFLKEYSLVQRMLTLIVLVMLIIALIFSYSRAAWLSMLFAITMFLIVIFKIKFRTLIVIIASTIVVILLFWTQVYMKLEKNRQDTSSDFSKQIQSVTNVSTDASNRERLNRWSCAIRMFKQRPVYGWGPGTYMFKYAPFQYSNERTVISTNFGDLGNAHSEYLGPLAESGVIGSLSFIAIVLATIYYAMRVYRKTTRKNEKVIILSVLIGLISYYIHGFLNNFLDTDKLSALFWGYTAIIVAIDIRLKKEMAEAKPALQEKVEDHDS
jgi:putative inorganic carbon (hco3(-)) transporter